jgi:hypothetical protein
MVSWALYRTSQEYRDACELWDLFVSTKSKLLEEQRPGEDAGQEHKGKIILKVGKLVSDKLNKEECVKPLHRVRLVGTVT